MRLIIDVGMRISLILGLLTGLSVVVLSLVCVEVRLLSYSVFQNKKHVS